MALQLNYEKFFELSLDYICVLDMKGYFVKVNRRFRELLAKSEKEIYSCPFWTFVAPEDRKTTEAEWVNIANGNPTQNFENRYPHPAGGNILIEWTAVFEAEAGLIYAVGRDITRKREGQEEFLEAILENIPDMIFVKEARDLRFVRFNRAGLELLGMSKDELIGKNDYDLFSKEEADHFTGNDREVFTRKGTLEIQEEPIKTRYKGKRILHTKKIPIFNADGTPKYLVGISEDITEKKQAQEAKKRAFQEQVARQETERSLQERDEFISIASHELKSPLSSLKLQAQIFRRNIERDPENGYGKERVDRLIDLTEKQVSRLVRLVDDMLDVSRIRTGRLSMEWAEFDLCEIVRDVLERSRSQFLSLEMAVPECLTSCEKLTVHWDRIRIEQVLMNLLTNAIRYGEGKPITIRLERKGAEAHLSVIDQGRGISEDKLELIFNRFQRALPYHEATGLGLGLFISKQIVLAHKGKIWAESKLGHGSVFHVQIPLQPHR